MRKELPINLDITYSGMIRDRNRLIAILSNDSNRVWYAENFIPLLLYPNGNIHCYDTTNFYEVFNLYDQVIDINIINSLEIDTVKKEIDNNRYIIALIDEYYLSGCIYYKTQHKHQEILIYGYDDEKMCFFFHGSQIEKKDYGCGECNYSDFIDGLVSAYEKINELESLSWRVLFGHPLSSIKVKEWNREINVRKIYYHFFNLLMGKSVTIAHDNNAEIYYAGSSIFDEMIINFDKLKTSEKQNYERSIWCVKLLAGYILFYKDIFSVLCSQHEINIDKEIYSMIDSINKDILSTYALLQKYVITGKNRNVDRAIEMIKGVKSNIGVMWEKICNSLQEYLVQEIN